MLSRLEFDENKTCHFKNFPAPHFFTTIQTADRYPLSDHKQIVILPEHSDTILFAPGYCRENGEVECDGLFTFLSDAALVLYSADCFPVLMTTIDKRFVGLLHVGWKGTDKEIARKAVELAVKVYPIEPKDIFIGIGPGIHKCCYDNEQVAEQLFQDNRWKLFISRGPLGPRIDLLDFNVQQLLGAGIRRQRITIASECTCCAKNKKWDYLFFSHHRSRKTGEKDGRFTTVISKF